MAKSKLDVKFFGAIAVARDTTVLGGRDFGGTKAKQLFQLLVLARGEPVPKDRLADQIWGESLPVHVNATLETYVSVLRRRLTPSSGEGRALITTAHEAYALPTEGYELDLARFDELVRLAAVAEPSARRRYLEDALEIASGEVLADEPYSDWAMDERWRYERRVIDTAVAASSAAMDDRDARRALEHAERAIALDALDERGYQAALLALHALGRDRDAIALFDRYSATTTDEDGESHVSEALRELRATIGRREAINLRPRGGGPHQATQAAASLTRRMLGRAGELDTLGRALAATSGGGSELVLVEGERGIGKTTLLEAASRELGDGVNVGWARCSELVSGIPYAAIALALREVLGRSEVDARSYPALAGIFPEMRVHSKRPAPRTVDTLEALVTLVTALAPLVLILDDLQWADSDTLVALGYLGNRGPLRGVTIVTAVRPEEVGSDHPVSRLQPTMRIPLGELDEHELAPLGIADLHHRTQGHPLFVSLAIADDEGGRRSLSEWVSDRCRAEGDDPYRLLSAACLVEESFTASRLAGVLGLKTGEVAESLDRLCRRRLLVLDDGRFRFRTRSMRAALADSLSPASRSLLEQRIALDGPPGPKNGHHPRRRRPASLQALPVAN